MVGNQHSYLAIPYFALSACTYSCELFHTSTLVSQLLRVVLFLYTYYTILIICLQVLFCFPCKNQYSCTNYQRHYYSITHFILLIPMYILTNTAIVTISPIINIAMSKPFRPLALPQTYRLTLARSYTAYNTCQPPLKCRVFLNTFQILLICFLMPVRLQHTLILCSLMIFQYQTSFLLYTQQCFLKYSFPLVILYAVAIDFTRCLQCFTITT